MSSHHDHHHHHDHDHDHDHDDHHHQDNSQKLSFAEKLIKIFEHWIKHNESHAQTYLDWGEKAKSQGLDEIAALLCDIAKLSDQLTEKLKSGLDQAKSN